MRLLNSEQLAQSPVVANCRMNRERQASGDNSYERELNLNPISFLLDRTRPEAQVRWLDLCCGSGNALIQAAQYLTDVDAGIGFHLIGVDLGGRFLEVPHDLATVDLVEASLETFTPDGPFDLITCVHGLHYVGDKLEVIRKYAARLKSDGVFVANLDVRDIFDAEGQRLDTEVRSWFFENKLDYDSTVRVLRCDGPREVKCRFEFAGANDQYGKNYTGQETVSSYYRRFEPPHPMQPKRRGR